MLNQKNNYKEKKIDFKIKEFGRAPFFTFLIGVFILYNVFIFISSILLNNNSEFTIKNLTLAENILFFGASNREAILASKQYWRIFLFPFVGYSFDFISAIFTFLSIYFTFWQIGYRHEILLGTKKTLIVWIFGFLFIALFQIFLNNDNNVIFYGFNIFSCLSLGSLVTHLLLKIEKDSQTKTEIKRIIFMFGLFLFFKIFFESINLYNSIYQTEQESLLIKTLAPLLFFPLLAFIFGGFLNLLVNREYINNNFIVYGMAIFFVLIFIILIFAIANTFLNGTVWMESHQIKSEILIKVNKYYDGILKG